MLAPSARQTLWPEGLLQRVTDPRDQTHRVLPHLRTEARPRHGGGRAVGLLPFGEVEKVELAGDERLLRERRDERCNGVARNASSRPLSTFATPHSSIGASLAGGRS